MPTSSDERRDTMEKWFGDRICEIGPVNFLIAHGYRLTPTWLWFKPVPSHTVSLCEYECLMFLIEEWDFGGIAE